MPRRSLLTPAERAGLLAFPTTNDELIQHYTFSEPDLSVIRQRRGHHNRLGFAVQLCYLRFPGFALPPDAEPPQPLLAIVGRQLHIEPEVWPKYAKRAETRREHLAELQAWLDLTPFAIADYRRFVGELAELAQQTDRGMVLAEVMWSSKNGHSVKTQWPCGRFSQMYPDSCSPDTNAGGGCCSAW